jgi:hypothetical protein
MRTTWLKLTVMVLCCLGATGAVAAPVTLMWQHEHAPQVTGFIVYQKTMVDGTFAEVGRTDNQTLQLAVDIPSYLFHCWQVTAYLTTESQTLESAPSNITCHAVIDGPMLLMPMPPKPAGAQ